jgi:UDPglucose--hexose-1-phosphate uridylyltransferase
VGLKALHSNRFFFSEQPHRRYNPLTGEWILVSPHRAQRPWQGKIESLPQEQKPAYDRACYLCPGNTRAAGARNPSYTTTFVFDNDFAALHLRAEGSASTFNDKDLLFARGEAGVCRVVCFSPRHDLTLAEMEIPAIVQVINTWIDEYQSLGRMGMISYVQIFENKGELMGCSNPHPHGQIWAGETVPVEPAKETSHQAAYRHLHGTCLLCDYLAVEENYAERVVCMNDHFVVLVPFWAIWPFETLVLSRSHWTNVLELSRDARVAFADIIRQITVRYDNLFETSFPYSMGVHQSPTDGVPHPEWHMHMHFYPPLLRSATVKKFMVGYEMLANPQRDITPEASAETLRTLSGRHYKVPAGRKE